MQDRNKMIRNIIIFLLLIVLTFMIIFRNYDIDNTISIILKTDIKYIILAIIAMLLNITFESLNIKNILASLGEKVPLLRMIRYSLIGFFFSGITPASGGGQPMEIYYMKKDNIPINKTTIALLLETCSFHIVTIICGIIGLMINTNILTKGLLIIFLIGMTLKMVILLIMLIGLFSKTISDKLVNIFVRILKKFNYNDIDKFRDNIDSALKEYHAGSRYLEEHKGVFIKSIITVFFQVLMYYTVTYFIYKSFGLNTYSYIKIIAIQAILFVSVSSIPLPGAVGISESVFLKIYITIFGINGVASAMILSRGISFYLFIIISLFVVLFSSIKSKKIIN